MEPDALLPYERSLSSGAALNLLQADGRVVPLEIERWLAPADAADRRALSWALGPVLDVGCGPGRILQAASELGLFGLGIDIARTAVRLSIARGQNALHRDVFGRVPGGGRWGSVLLLDGNVGIGGDPHRLLRRCHALVRDGGRLVVETDPDPSCDEAGLVQFTTHGTPLGPPFRWARVGAEALAAPARAARWRPVASWSAAGRCFTVLAR